jgi:hypothetical protein
MTSYLGHVLGMDGHSNVVEESPELVDGRTIFQWQISNQAANFFFGAFGRV